MIHKEISEAGILGAQKYGSVQNASRDFSYKGFTITVSNDGEGYKISIRGKGLQESFAVTSSAEGIKKAEKIIDGWIEDEI